MLNLGNFKCMLWKVWSACDITSMGYG